MIIAACAFPLAAQQASVETLDAMAAEMLTANPDLDAARARVEMERSRIAQAWTPPAPTLTFRAMEFPWFRPGEAMYHNFELMQMVMFPTKSGIQRDIASLETAGAERSGDEDALALFAQLRTSRAMFWGARRMTTINAMNAGYLRQIVAAAESQYAVGAVSQQDVLKARVEQARIQNQEAEIQRMLTSAEAMLRATLNRPADHPIGIVVVDSVLPPIRPVEELIRHSLANRPMLARDSLRIAQADLMVSMAKQEYIPDLTFGIERVTMPMGGMNSWSVTAGITLPFAPWTLFGRAAKVDEANAERTMRTSMLRSSQVMAVSDVRDADAAMRAAAIKVQTFEMSILPNLRQSLESALTEYQTGRTSFLMLLDSYRMYAEMQMDAVSARMDFERESARLARLAGVADLTTLASLKVNR